MNRPQLLVPITNPISLLVTIGNNVDELHAYLKDICQLQVINCLFDEKEVPEQLRKHGWTVGYRNENPSTYIRSALSLHKTNHSSVIVVSTPGNIPFLDILLTKDKNIFSKIVIATSAETPLSSFIVSYKDCLNGHKYSKKGHSELKKECNISPRDIQKHADYLMGLETYIRKFIPRERNYIQMNLIVHIASQLLDDIHMPIPKLIPPLSKLQDPWRWLSDRCHPEILFRLKFAFDRKNTYSSSGQLRSDKLQYACVENASPFVNFRKCILNSSHVDECQWAILIAIPQHGAFEAVQSTVTTLANLGNIQETLSDIISNTNEFFDEKNEDPLCSVNIYASTMSNEDHKFCKASNIFDNVLELSAGDTICQAWETLAKHAISKGATRLLLSDGSLTIKSGNWISRAEKQFQAGSICVELAGKANHPTQGNGSRLISLHVSHICLFGLIFPHSIGSKEGSFTFLREIWERTGWFATIYADITQCMSQKLLTCEQRFMESDSASFRDKPLEHAFSVLRKCKSDFNKSFIGNFNKPQLILDENEFQVLHRLDVIIPTFRLPVENLRRIVSLRASIPCLVTFWIVIDNPNHPNVYRLLSELNNVTVPHPYTQRHDLEYNGLYRTRVLVHPHNYGASAARNTGLMASLADWALLLDDDVTPSNDILDAYLSAILKHDCYNDHFSHNDTSPLDNELQFETEFNKRVDILAGVTRFPKPHSFWQHALVLSNICAYYGSPVDWPLTANACIRVRHNPRLFDTKNRGGEAIDYLLRVRQCGNRMIVLPDALATHPWFGSSATTALIHTSKWMLGESKIAEDLKHTHTIIIAPGWAECIVLYLPIGILTTLFENNSLWSLIKTVFSIFATEFLCRTVLMSIRAFKQVGFRRTLLVASFSAILQMSHDVVRVCCHLQRYRADCLFRKLHLNDGERSTLPLQIISVLKFFFTCFVIFHLNLQNMCYF